MNGMTINPQGNLLQVSHYMRSAELDRNTSMERLSTGARVNYGADDPSGLAISSGMKGQLRGLDTAIHNLSESIDLIHAADTVLSEVGDIFLRIRDLCLKGANQAAIKTVVGDINSQPMSDSSQIFREIMILQVEVYRTATGMTHNGKRVYHDFSPPDGQVAQVGPDNGIDFTIPLEIPDLEGLGIPQYIAPAGNITSQQYTAAFQQVLGLVDVKLQTVSDTRAALGVQEKRMTAQLQDLTAQSINISASNSKIADADMAGEMVNMTRANIKSNFSAMAYAQANVDPKMVFTLMNSAGL